MQRLFCFYKNLRVNFKTINKYNPENHLSSLIKEIYRLIYFVIRN